MVVIDNIDMNILELLSRDGRASAIQISKNLAEQGISLTSRSVLNRMKRLEKYRDHTRLHREIKPDSICKEGEHHGLDKVCSPHRILLRSGN